MTGRPMAGISFRDACASDCGGAVPLVYASGPDAFRYVFETRAAGGAPAFLQRAWNAGSGEFGYRTHVVAEVDGRVIAVGAMYSGRESREFTRAAVTQILRHFGPLVGLAVLWRGLRAERVIRPPRRDVCYLAHLSVAEELRGLGIGSQLVGYLLERGRGQGFAVAGIDVAHTNGAARALYERLGFRHCETRRSTLRRGDVTVAGHDYMEMSLLGNG